MSDDLLMGWVKTELGEIGEIVTGSTPPKNNPEYFGDDIPFYKPTDLDAGYEVIKAREYLSTAGAQKSRLLPSLSILVTCIGATIGKTGLSRLICTTNQQINAIVPFNDLVNPFWLYRVITSPALQQAIVDNSSSTTLPILNKSRFSKLLIPLPPLNEQRRIVDKLERIGDRHRTARNELNHIPKLIARYKQAVLAAVYTNLIEQESIFRTLGECSLEVRNGLSNKPIETECDIKILRISAVRQGRVNTEDVRFYVPKVNEDITRYYLQKGDLLFTRYNGNADYVGVCGMFMDEVENFVYPDKLIRVRVNSAIVIPEFIELIFQTPQVRETLRSYIKTSAGQHGISGGDLKSITIPVPSTTSQRLIVENTTQKFNFLRAILREHETIQSLLDRLEQATLAKAFRGELVPQDPDDEPASVLLEQVKSQKEKGKIKTKK